MLTDNVAKKLKSQAHKIAISRPDFNPPPHDSPLAQALSPSPDMSQ